MILVLIMVLVGALATWLVLRQQGTAIVPSPSAGAAKDGARIEAILQELCRNSPQMVSLHLPNTLPVLPIDPTRLEATLSTFLEFFARRRARGILVAAGCGALSVEVVMADAGTDLPDPERVNFFEWEHWPVAARMELDAGFQQAHEFVLACGGTLAIESRLEGGVCLRCRIPHGNGKSR